MPRPASPIDRPSSGGALDPPPLFPPNFQRLALYRNRQNIWTHMVSGKFSKSPFSGLLFYEQSKGYAEFYKTTGLGELIFVRNHTNWPKTWTHIVPGSFYDPDRTGLLFYDQGAGFAVIYDVDENGELLSPHEHAGWRPSWTHITTIRIPDSDDLRNSDYSGVLLYDQAAGHGEIHRCKGSGELELIVEEDGWRKSWTHVVGDSASGSGLLFYEASTTHAEVYSVTYNKDDKVFSFEQQAEEEGLPAATDIIPGNFGWVDTSYVFYDRPSGQGAFVFYNPPPRGDNPGIKIGAEAYADWPTSWDVIVPGNFWEPDPEYTKFQDGFTDLLLYDRANGYGEFYLHEPFGAILCQDLEGYASPGSVVPGETINLYVNSRAGPYTINIYRQDVDEVLMTTVQNIQQFPQPFPIGRLDYRDGPAWPPVAELVIPQDWPSGLYLARVAALENANPTAIPFVVRATNPGSHSKILVYVPDTTYEAYNFWGGRGLYGFRSKAGLWYAAPQWSYGSTWKGKDNHELPRSFQVAFARPYNDDLDIAKWQKWEVPLLRWLARRGISAELCTATDLHKDQANHTGFLNNYRLLVSVGHDEYWSKEMRENVEAFAEAGGNVAFFSANVCWFQVRFDLNVKRQICYKDARFDPTAATQSHLTTVNWFDEPVCKPETAVTGVSYYAESSVNPSALYRVREPGHWVFGGLDYDSHSFFGLYKDQDGNPRTVVGPETDKYQPSSPSNFVRLADIPPLTDAANKEAPTTGTMGIFTKGKGQVFTAATINWSLGLSQNDESNDIDQITQNVFDRLG